MYRLLVDLGIAARCKRVPAEAVAADHLALVHSSKYLATVESWKDLPDDEMRSVALNYNSVYLNTHSVACAKLSAGSTVRLVSQVASGELDSALAIVRPPGHHAGVSRSLSSYTTRAAL